mgnify:CR=1 FL=1
MDVVPPLRMSLSLCFVGQKGHHIYPCIDVNPLYETTLFCSYPPFYNIFGYILPSFFFSHEKNLSEKTSLHCSFDADDVFIMMSDIGSHCDYFAYSPLK